MQHATTRRGRAVGRADGGDRVLVIVYVDAPGRRSSSDGHAATSVRAAPTPVAAQAGRRAVGCAGTPGHLSSAPRAALPVHADRRRRAVLVQQRRRAGSTTRWSGFTLRRTGRTRATSPGMCDSLQISLEDRRCSPRVVATVLGTMAAFALVRHRFRGRSLANLLIFLPMATPEVVLGSSLLTLFLNHAACQLGLSDHLHRARDVLHQLRRRDREGAARRASTRGSSRRRWTSTPTRAQTFWRVTFPLVLPGIVSAALLASRCRFDDFIITNFNAGSTVTFPMFVWGATSAASRAGQRDRQPDLLPRARVHRDRPDRPGPLREKAHLSQTATESRRDARPECRRSKQSATRT